MDEIVTQPLILRKKSRSSRFSSWSGDANSFRDKLFRSIYIFLLFALDLVMFIYSVNGRLLESDSVNLAVFVILGAVFLVSFVLILLLSFSIDLQNALCGLFTTLITVAFFYQFRQGDVNNFLDVWFSKHASWLSFICVFPSPWIIGFLLGAFIFVAFRFSDAILFITLVLLFSGVIGVEKNEILRRTNAEYQEIQELPLTAGEVSETSVVYLMLPKLPSYQFLNSIRDTNFREFRDLLIGFYATNDFEIYPNAFVKNGDTMSNIIDILNQVDYTSTTSANRGFSELDNNWNFIHGGLDKYVLEYDQLYDYMVKQGFGVSKYAMPGFNFCVADNAFFSDRCVIKGYKTVSLFDKNVSLENNVFALLGEWVLSLKIKELRPIAKKLIASSTLKNMKVISENRRVSLEGGAAIFEKLSSDYRRDEGGQFYLAYVDLPSDVYIYDEFCNVKPRDKWVSLKDNTITSVGIDEKRKAYADQAKCLVGKLQEYMEEISETPRLKKTDIFIQGVSPLRELAGVTGDMYSNFVADKLVNLAIRKGKKPKFLINANVCLASDFTKTWLKNQDYCYTLDNMSSYSADDISNLRKNLINNSLIRGSRISNIVATYQDWWETYKEHSASYQRRLKRKHDEELARLRREEELRRLEAEESRAHAVVTPQKSMSQNNDNIFIPSEDDGRVEIEENILPDEEVLPPQSLELPELDNIEEDLKISEEVVLKMEEESRQKDEASLESIIEPQKTESVSIEKKVASEVSNVPEKEAVVKEEIEEKFPEIKEQTAPLLPVEVKQEQPVEVEIKVEKEISVEPQIEPIVSLKEEVTTEPKVELSLPKESQDVPEAVPAILSEPLSLPIATGTSTEDNKEKSLSTNTDDDLMELE